MNNIELIKLLGNQKKLDDKIEFYLKKGMLVKQEIIESEIKGHIQKSEHNINFVQDISFENYSDWAVVGCYYASYHIAIALALKKGFVSKNHDATLCILIKYYYKKYLDGKDLEMFNEIYLNNKDILFYADSKKEREKASYSTQTIFNKENVLDLKKNTLMFVNKCKEILEE